MNKEAKQTIKGKENEIVIARQCANQQGFYCYNKDCLNYCCILHPQYEKLRYKK